MLRNKYFSSKSSIIIFSLLLLALALMCREFFIHTHLPETVVKRDVETKEVEMIANPEEYVKQCKFDIPEQAKVVGAAIVRLNENETVPSKTNRGDSQIPWGIPYYYVENIEISESCETEVPPRCSAMGPGTLTTYLNEGVPATWNSNTRIRADKVSKALGFDVTMTYEVSTSHTIHIPVDKTYELAAYLIYELYNFDVYYSPIIGSDYHAGSGQAQKPSGVCFVWYEI